MVEPELVVLVVIQDTHFIKTIRELWRCISHWSWKVHSIPEVRTVERERVQTWGSVFIRVQV